IPCLMVHCDLLVEQPSEHQHLVRENMNMYRFTAALFLLVASTAASFAQGLLPSVWQSERGAILKILTADPVTGTFSGVFLSNPAGPCPLVPYNVAGGIRGNHIGFRTSRTWTPDCSVTAVWSGRFVAPATIVARWRTISGGPRTGGTEIFHKL